MRKGIRLLISLFCLVSLGYLVGNAAESSEMANAKEIKELIQHYIGTRLAISPLEIEVHLLGELGDTRKGIAASPHLAVRESNGTSLLGNGMFLLVSEESTEKVPPLWVNVRSEWVHPAVVAARFLKKNQIVSLEDLTIQTVHSDQPGDYLSQISDLIGKRVVLQERAGTVMTRDMVQNPPLFYQGERVTLLVETGHLKIMASGKALEDGYKGKSVSVLNLDSHRTVFGEPLDGATVKVSLGRD
ncbi:MAG: flagellar basal body P-ring formation protein FlgA [Nitrospirae bacterium]|nr:flagellar basal body P-ring formation protein FlgA [Nitrospirota bacterium]